jgi:hypothetical protein
VKRSDKFLISKRPYAVDLSSLRTTNRASYYDCRITAVWFRRRRGDTVACIGTLWDFQDELPATGIEMLERHDDGRYGGNCAGRWDGTGYWGAEELDKQAAHLEILKPMLEHYPATPEGFDGWWTF